MSDDTRPYKAGFEAMYERMHGGTTMDIIERLRQHALPDPHDEREVLHAPLLREAAEEIRRLRQDNAQLQFALEQSEAAHLVPNA